MKWFLAGFGAGLVLVLAARRAADDTAMPEMAYRHLLEASATSRLSPAAQAELLVAILADARRHFGLDVLPGVRQAHVA